MATRKQFIGQSSLGLLSFLSFSLPAFSNNETGFEGVVVNDDEGEAYQLKGGRAVLRIKVAKINGAQSMCFLSESFPPGEAILVHKHLNEDEFIFLHKGSGLFTLGEKEYQIKEGAFAFVPKGVWHGLQNTGDVNIEMRFGYCPSGFENFFREIGAPVGQPYIQKSLEERRAIAERYGFVGRPKN
ncbi:MAG: cupin domain-containing protein [Ferruginibacter sp.]